MTIKETITKADSLRPNTLEENQKYEWICELDEKVGEMMGDFFVGKAEHPEDRELLMPFPYDNIYPLYTIAMIDFYNQETPLYENDMQMFNAAWDEALAWWRRNNRPDYAGNWRIV